ncbi:MAG: 50S ribosomal protein L18 [SAR324 cluster bacterium]|nr:50S ribosomal protein L18 [SAR324 cluster bacterium]MBF0353186.1 50S ribosomal protein L18 [SAR324 cluster bacterium]
MPKTSQSMLARKHRHKRIRKKITGSSICPRLSVFRSAKHVYVQAIDDEKGQTLACSSTISLKSALQGYSGNLDAAVQVGKDIAQKLLTQSIDRVVFDRGGFLYHGRVKALAEAARENGLQF